MATPEGLTPRYPPDLTPASNEYRTLYLCGLTPITGVPLRLRARAREGHKDSLRCPHQLPSLPDPCLPL